MLQFRTTTALHTLEQNSTLRTVQDDGLCEKITKEESPFTHLMVNSSLPAGLNTVAQFQVV